MMYAVMVFVALLGLGAYKIDNNAEKRGAKTAEAACLEVKNEELRVLNLENADLINQLNLQRADNQTKLSEIDNETKRKLGKIRADSDAAADDLARTFRMLLNEAENSGKDENSETEDGHSTTVSRRTGTQGSQLTPETIYDLKQVSFAGNEAIVLLRSCVAKYNKIRESADREPVETNQP